MTPPALQRFRVDGVFWRQFLRWAVLNIPIWLEPVAIASWTLVFLLWGPGRQGVMKNLAVILPGSSAVANFFRTYRVFWNFAWVITDTVRYKELRTVPEWEFEGWEHFEKLLSNPAGAIILTAHMGSYDLGAQLFAEIAGRGIVMVRAPESDPETRRFEEALDSRTRVEGLSVDFSTRSTDLALDLLDALQRGEIVAIQGDRVTPGIRAIEGRLFGTPMRFPGGPFALAMTARVPIYPLFIVRLGRRRYRLVVREPLEVTRTASRSGRFDAPMEVWREHLEEVIGSAWFQWFAFRPFWEDPA